MVVIPLKLGVSNEAAAISDKTLKKPHLLLSYLNTDLLIIIYLYPLYLTAASSYLAPSMTIKLIRFYSYVFIT